MVCPQPKVRDNDGSAISLKKKAGLGFRVVYIHLIDLQYCRPTVHSLYRYNSRRPQKGTGDSLVRDSQSSFRWCKLIPVGGGLARGFSSRNAWFYLWGLGTNGGFPKLGVPYMGSQAYGV